MFDISIEVSSNLDCYSSHMLVINKLTSIGCSSERMLYCINPLDTTELIIRSVHEEAVILGDAEPMIKVEEANEYYFCLKVAPIVHFNGGKRIEVLEKEKWIRKRLESNGAAVIDIAIKSFRRWCAKGSGFHLPELQALGKICVTDSEKLHIAMCNGIGRQRTFGFGLLQLLPVGE